MEVSARKLLAVMGFLATTSMYMSKLDLSIAIVAMVGESNSNGDSANTASSSYCGNISSVFEKDHNDNGDNFGKEARPLGEFDWDPKERGEILGSYYYGNALSQILAGWLAAKMGFKRVSE